MRLKEEKTSSQTTSFGLWVQSTLFELRLTRSGFLLIFSCPENKIRSFERSLKEFGFTGRRQRFIHLWFDGLPKGKSQTVVLELGKTAGVTTALTAKRLEDDSLIILAHSPEIRNPLYLYRSRWSIRPLA